MKHLSRRRKILFAILTAVLGVMILEAGLFVGYGLLKRRAFPVDSYDETLRRVAAGIESPEEVIHPYLGYVRDPEKTDNTSYLGFPQAADDLLEEPPADTLSVAIFGGSFAEGASVSGEETLRSVLRAHGSDSRILTAAMGGYKQPQQLFALAYLLSHGARFDAVVNIDGFNEVALPRAEHLARGVNAFYPWSWYQLTLGLNDRDSLARIGQISALRDQRRRWAAFFQDLPKFSITRNVVWRYYDKVLDRRTRELYDRLRQARVDPAKRFMVQGFDLGAADETGYYRRIAEHWTTCSLLMKALCDARGIIYLHLLQPNQYFEAGKTLSPEERREAFREDSLYRPGVVKGYPSLLAAKNALIDGGVDFHDLTMIFRKIPDTIYQDDCCHPNPHGYQIIADYIGRAIVEARRRRAPGAAAR